MNETTAPGAYRVDSTYDDPDLLGRTLRRRILPLVSRPGRYIGGELGAVRPGWRPEGPNILLAFPDAYEIGMSHLGLRILYSQLNRQDAAGVDLVFAPWPDMEARMRAESLPLFGLQSRRPAGQFDLIGFSLCYELSYTNLLTMLDLAGLPLLAADRTEGHPVVVAGGSCTFNPTVMAPFVDLFFLGDGEETITEIPQIFRQGRAAGEERTALVERLARLPGAWHPGAGAVSTRVLDDLNRIPLPDPLVPIIEPVHDRLSLEVMRGCARGCRFCQAGMINRPVRERDPGPMASAAAGQACAAGWQEVSLLSLSTSDYSGLAATLGDLGERLEGTRTNLVLPSLRLDSMDAALYAELGRQAPASYTFAPEAGSQRLRDVINKQITDDEILQGTRQALAAGAKRLKLYFMTGLPTETDADLDALVDLVGRVVALAPRGGNQVTVSISPFAPKPHTTFQWAGQISAAEIGRRNSYLAERLRSLRVKVSLREPEVSVLEALLGMGDGRLGEVVLAAWRAGARFDGWSEQFRPELWWRACADQGVDPAAVLRPRDPGADLPWDSVLAPAHGDFLREDWERALAGEALADCRLGGECYACQACDGELDHRFADLPQGAKPADSPDAGVAEKTPAFDPRNASRQDPTRERRAWSIWRQQASAKCWYRVEYAKEGDLIWLGHLDFQRQLQLALRRSGLPVAYSQGFHPHPLLKFGPPLPVGVAGQREVLDLAFGHEVPGWEDVLAPFLSPGLRMRRSVVLGRVVPWPIDRFARRYDYRVTLPPPAEGGLARAEVREKVDEFLTSKHWPHVRRHPKGDMECDARALVPTGGLGLPDEQAGDQDDQSGVQLAVSLLKPEEGTSLSIFAFLAALFGEALPEPRLCEIRRTGYRGLSRGKFWRLPIEEVGDDRRRFWLRQRLNA